MLKRVSNKIRTIVVSLLKSKAEKRHSLVGAGKFWRVKRDFQINFLKSQGLMRSHTFLDIGCGTLRGGIPIIDYLNPNLFYGIDVREEVIFEGKLELKETRLDQKEPTLIVFEKFNTLEFDVKFDVIFAFSVLIHLDDDTLNSCFEFVSNNLQPEGRFYANVNIGASKDGKWFQFPVVFRSFEFYQKMAKSHKLQLEVLGNLNSLGHITGKNSDHHQYMLKISKN